MPRTTSASSVPSLLPSAIPKDVSQDSPTAELPLAATCDGLTTQTSTDPSAPATVADIAASPVSRSFTPFFTLINDAHRSTTHHPRVHYIFSDDDTEILTETLLRIHDNHGQSPPPPVAPHDTPSTASPAGQNPSTITAGSRGEGEPRAGERYVVVELGKSGEDVKEAVSLTSDWAVLSTAVTEAPTLVGGVGDVDGVGGERGLLLRIEGMEGKGGGGEVEKERSLEELVEVFGRRMGELRGVVDGSGGGVVVGKGGWDVGEGELGKTSVRH